MTYFSQLASHCVNFIDSLKLPNTPMTINEINTSFRERVSLAEKSVITEIMGLDRPAGYSNDGLASGMNTVGLLLDRLTILMVCHVKQSGADEPFSDYMMDIIEALEQAKPGHSSKNTKVTTLQQQIDIDTFEAAAVGLLTTNIILWEAQEILYNRNIESLPDRELRAYITLFSKDNIRRNQLIELFEQLFWGSRRLI